MNILLALHILVREYVDRFKSTFQPGLFITAVFALVIGLFLLNQTPLPDDAKFIGVVDAIAQSEIMGISTPVAFFYISGFFIFVSRLVKVVSFRLNKKQ